MLSQHRALRHHYILYEFLLTVAPGTTLTKMYRLEGARPPDGWSCFVLVPHRQQQSTTVLPDPPG